MVVAATGRVDHAGPHLRGKLLVPVPLPVLVLVLGSVAGLVPACASDEVATVYNPCAPLTIALDPDASADEVRGVEDAIQLWSEVLPVQITIGTGERDDDVLPIHFEAGVPYRAMYWDSIGVISINRERVAPADYSLAIAHEMGHAFGLLHVGPEERPSVMNVGNLEVAPTAEDAAGVRACW
jgi:hypothetical protein